MTEESANLAKTQRTAALSLLLALLVCVPFLTAIAGIVLAIGVILASRDGVDRGRRLAYAALVVAVVAIMAWSTLLVAASMVEVTGPPVVEGLRSGDCVDLVPVVVVDCAGPHDAEVVATRILLQDDARDYDGTDPALCREVMDDPVADVVPLTTSPDPNAGDVMACLRLSD